MITNKYNDLFEETLPILYEIQSKGLECIDSFVPVQDMGTRSLAEKLKYHASSNEVTVLHNMLHIVESAFHMHPPVNVLLNVSPHIFYEICSND